MLLATFKTYRKISGIKTFIDIEKIIKLIKIPIKLSMLLTPFNEHEISDYIKNAKKLGMKRIIIKVFIGKICKFFSFKKTLYLFY